MKRFGEKLRALRTSRDMTLRQLATALGYTTHGFIGLVESGERKPNVELLWRVSKLFNISADVLLDDERELE